MSARAHWESNISRRRASEAPPRILPAPSTLTARAGSGHVSLEWSGVEGAAGYLIHHAPGPEVLGYLHGQPACGAGRPMHQHSLPGLQPRTPRQCRPA